MSHHEYEVSKYIAAQDYPFYSLIMAAMRQADTTNLERLQLVFPLVLDELKARYNSPGGYLAEEQRFDSRVIDSVDELQARLRQEIDLPPIEPQHEDAVHEAETLNREGD